MTDVYATLDRNLYRRADQSQAVSQRTVFDTISEALMSGEIDVGMGLGRAVSYQGKINQTLKMGTVFETESRFSKTTSGSTANFGGGKGIRFNAGIVADQYAVVYLPVSGVGNADIPVFDDTAFSAVIRMDTTGTLGGNFYVGVKDDQGTLNGTTLNLSGIDQYGFKFVKSAGVVTLYATSSNDNGTETTTVLGTPAEDETIYMAASCEKDYRVSFQVTSTSLTASTMHRDNIPSSSGLSDAAMTLFINNANTASDFGVDAAAFSFEKFSGGLY